MPEVTWGGLLACGLGREGLRTNLEATDGVNYVENQGVVGLNVREVKYDQMKGFAGLSDLAVTCDYAEGHINGVMGQKLLGAEGGGAR